MGFLLFLTEGAYIALETQPLFTFGNQFSGSLVREAKVKGNHGWPPTNSEMLGIFLMQGPNVAVGKVIEQV
jgi:hypothetical protein